MMTEITKRDLDRLMNPRNLDDILARYRKEDTAMSDDKIKLRQAVAREREAAALLGEEIVRLARATFPDKSLSEYVEIAYGGLDALREERHRQETVRLAERRDSGRRQAALEIADLIGVDRAIVEAELDREEGA